MSVPPEVEVANSGLHEGLLLRYIGYSMRRAEVLMRQEVAITMARWNLRPTEFSALTLLYNNTDVTSADLGMTLDIKRPNVVTLVNKLVEQGLVERSLHPNDGRSQLLSLTPKAIVILDEAHESVYQTDRLSTACLSADEREQLIDLLQRVVRYRRRH